MRMRVAVTAAGMLAALVVASPAAAQTPQVRLAASTDCHGSYPAARPIGVATVGRPKGELRRFVRWARRDRTARRVIATRYVPIAVAP